MANINDELLKRRFIHTTWSKWNSVANKSQYDNSIVFIKEDPKKAESGEELIETGKGVAIYTQGHLFEMSNEADVKNIINSYLEKGANIQIESIDGKLVISATDTTYSPGTGLKLDGTTFNHINSVEGVSLANAEMAKQTPTSSTPSFTFKTYGYDDQGHILGSKDATVELPATAFKDTTYEVTMAAGNSNEVSLNTKKDGKAENTYTIKGDKGTTVSFKDNVMTITSDTASDILGTLNVTDTAVANQYVSEVDQTNGKITVTRETLPVYGVNETAVDGLKLSLTDGKVGLVDDGLAADLTSKNITLETAATATEGYLKTYVLKQGATEIGKIDLPKELVVTGGEVITAEEDNAELKLVKGEKYLKLTIANQTNPVYIAVKDLVDVYTSGNGITISNSNEISVKLHENDNYLGFDADKCLVTKVGELHVMDVQETDGSYYSGAAVKTSGLATVENVANIINKLDKDIDAVVYDEGKPAVLADGEIAVVTGITQHNGRITSVDSAAVVNKTYVDSAIDNAEGTLSLENGENDSTYVFGIKNDKGVEQDGYVKASEVSTILNAAWAWGTI